MSKSKILVAVSAATALVVFGYLILVACHILGLVLGDKGWNAYQAGQYGRGHRMLRIASFLAPMRADVWERRCDAYDYEKHPDEMSVAIETCKRAVWLDPNNKSFARRDLGFAYANAHEYREAAAAFAPLANYNDDASDLAYIHRPYVVSLLLAKDYQGAIPAGQRILSIGKGGTGGGALLDESLLGMAYEGAGDTERARKAFGADKTCRITRFTRGNITIDCRAR